MDGRTSRIARPLAGVAFLAVLLLCAFATPLAPLSRPSAALPEFPVAAVYYTDGRSATLTPGRVGELGLRPVVTFAALRVAAERADAIVIDRAVFPQVEPLWLAQQQRRGLPIVGIDIPLPEQGLSGGSIGASRGVLPRLC